MDEVDFVKENGDISISSNQSPATNIWLDSGSSPWSNPSVTSANVPLKIINHQPEKYSILALEFAIKNVNEIQVTSNFADVRPAETEQVGL